MITVYNYRYLTTPNERASMPADLTPIEELDQNILNLCTRINAATQSASDGFDVERSGAD